jgi:4-amino-4-deoxy-L-arabinose transferase-like glycosyltransferase
VTASVSHPTGKTRLALYTIGVAVVLFLALFNLRDYPTTWFDEGSHLHVPQTLIRFGEYADYSSDGFRYYGPTLGVGPTVLVPIAAVYKLFGVDLLQARLVIVVYLLLAVWLFYRLARSLGSVPFALGAVALLLSSPTVAFVETGRQVLGEVPAFAFLSAGLLVWFSAWECRGGKLTLAGLLLGAAAVTKYQNLIVLAPTLLIAWGANAFYYRTARQRVFLVPGILVAASFAAWQALLVLYLGPSTGSENFAVLREASAGAAAAFSPELMKRAVRELLSFQTYGGALLLAMAYGAVCSLGRTRQSQQWGILFTLVACNLVWYVVASIGWPRYAFTGLAIAALFVARLFEDLLVYLRSRDLDWRGWVAAGNPTMGLSLAVATWAIAIVIPGLAAVALPIVRPAYNAPAEMAAYLDRTVPQNAVIETWEPELGALTAHNYHYPPSRLLAVAVRHVWLGGPGPALQYTVRSEKLLPPFVVVGSFSRWVGLYATSTLEPDYQLVTTIGGYELYKLKRAQSAVAGDETNTQAFPAEVKTAGSTTN